MKFKSIIAILALLYSGENTLVAGQRETKEMKEKDRGHYVRGGNPGLMLRLEQSSINGLKWAF